MLRFFSYTKNFLGLITWQISLVIIILSFLFLTGIIAIASPEAVEGIQNSAIDFAKSNFTDIITINLGNNVKDVDVFVYDKLSAEKDRPLDVKVYEKNQNFYLDLYPGAYRIVFVKEGYYPVEKDLTIDVGIKKIEFIVSYDELADENKDEFKSDSIDDNSEKVLIIGDRVDLNVDHFDYEKYADSSDIRIWATVMNSGANYEKGFEYRFLVYENGKWEELTSGIYIDNLNFKQTEQFESDWDSSAKKGIYKFRFEVDPGNLVVEEVEGNNTREFEIDLNNTYLSSNKSDVVIRSLNIDNSNGDNVDSLVINNMYSLSSEISASPVGSVKTIDVNWVIWRGEELVKAYTETYELELSNNLTNIVFKWQPEKIGNYRVVAFADSKQKINESNELNNMMTVKFDVYNTID